MMYILVAIHSHFFISSNILAFSVPNESYSRNASSSLNLISAFLLIGVSSSTFHYFVIFWQNAILDFIDVLLFMRYKRLKQVNFMRLLNTQMQFKQKTPDNNNGRKKKRQKYKQWFTKHYTENKRSCNTNQHKKMGMGDSSTPEGFSVLAPQVAPVKARHDTLVEKVISDNEEGTGLWLRQTEHIRRHLCHIYSVNWTKLGKTNNRQF
jgi:hypothetical protein